MNKQEKKLKTVSTSVKEENVEITQVTANGNVVIHPVTKAQNVKYKNSNLNDVLENKIALDGDGGQNFNFIEDKVVQDGLIYSEHNKVKNKTISKDLVNSIFYLNTTFTQDFSETGYVGYGIRQLAQVHINKNKFTVKLKNPNGNIVDGVYQITLVKNINQLEMCVVNNILTIILNNIVVGVFDIYPLTGVQTIDIANDSKNESYCENVFLYSRLLTPQEIQHNISVLNNSQSIKELHTTDSTGKTSILKLGSNSHHTEMASGRTLEEEYTSLLGRFGKEINSPDGSAIQVNDGISGKVLKMSIKGQTVKNLLPTEFATTKKTITTGFTDVKLDLSLFKPNTQYDFVVSVSKNTLNKDFHLYNSYNGFFNSSYNLAPGVTGIIRFSKTTLQDMVGTRFLMGAIDETRTGEIVIDWIAVVEGGDGQFVTGAMPFGLSSTQAIISNNGQQYPICEPTIQGKTRILKATKDTQNWVEISDSEARDTVTYDYKLDSIAGDLGSVPNSSDYIDRARKVKGVNTKEITLDNTYNYVAFTPQTSGTFKAKLRISDAKANSNVLCNILKYEINSGTSAKDYEFITLDGNKDLVISISSSKVNSLEQLKVYMKQQLDSGTPVCVRYPLEISISQQLTDEQFKVYDSYKKVISLGGVGGVQDTLEIKDDGSGVVTNKLMNIDFSKGIPNGIGVNPNGTDSDNFVTVRLNGIIQPVSFVGICNKFNTWNGSATYDNKHIFRYGNEIYFVIPREEIAKYGYTGNDVVDEVNNNARRNYLIQEGIQVLYEVAPTTTHIPKELIPTVLTHNQTNILEAGGAVKPSSFKATVPVDKLAEIEARLQALESTAVDVVLNK